MAQAREREGRSLAAVAEPVPIPTEGLDDGVTVNADGVWRVEHTLAARKTFAITSVEKPVIGEEQYAVLGEVRYEGVQGKGVLELWNHFGDRSFFTRTVNDKGPLRAITGDSDWRAFALPFHKGEEPDPNKLMINVVLEGQGVVEVRNLHLEVGKGWMGGLYPGAWWAPRTSGIIGSVLGITAGLLGTIIGFCRKSPQWHGLAMGCCLLLLATGVVSLFGAVAGLVSHQPGYVYWLFLLFGVIGTWVGADALRQLRKQRTEHELRRMDAADATS